MTLCYAHQLRGLSRKTGLFGLTLTHSQRVVETFEEMEVPARQREDSLRRYGIGKVSIEKNGSEINFIVQRIRNNSLVRYVVNWGRLSSLWPVHLTTACCSVEFAGTVSPRYDPERFGFLPATGSLRQSDVIIVEGTVTTKMAQRVRIIYDQMPEPKWVVAMGACAISGGLYAKHSYNVLQGIDDVLPVDVYIPGCPPRPETLIQGLLLLRDKILSQRV